MGDPAQRGRAADRSRGGLLAAEQHLQQVDADVVGQPGHRDVGEFLGGTGDVQGAADADAGLVQQGEPFPAPELLGHVDHRGAQSDQPAHPVPQRGRRRREDVIAVQVRRHPAADVEARHRLPGRQDPAHPAFPLRRVGPGQHVGQALARPVRVRDPRLTDHRGVLPYAPQIRVVDRHGHRAAVEHPVAPRLVVRARRLLPGSGGHHQPLGRAARVRQRVGPYRHLHAVAVPVDQRDLAVPLLRVRRQVHRTRGERLGGEQVGGGTPHDVPRAVSEQPGSLRIPGRDHPPRVDDGQGRGGARRFHGATPPSPPVLAHSSSLVPYLDIIKPAAGR